jgi:GT2 family glycosyltransferase
VPQLSVIIPTCKRAVILLECIHRLEAQTIRDRIEVIVVSDGPDAETADMMHDRQFQVPISFFSIPKSQQGVARNRGTERAAGAVCFYIGDDIFLGSQACEMHLKIHHESPEITRSVLGFTEWDPAVGITPAMKWLDRSGWQFAYDRLTPYAHKEIPRVMQHRFTYTSNISIPTQLALRFPFREDLSLYGWEDIELGWRLSQAGIPLFYEPSARALHHHRLTVGESIKRMELLGASAAILREKKMELGVVPQGIKYLKLVVASFLPTLRGKHARAFLRGLTTPIQGGKG